MDSKQEDNSSKPVFIEEQFQKEIVAAVRGEAAADDGNEVIRGADSFASDGIGCAGAASVCESDYDGFPAGGATCSASACSSDADLAVGTSDSAALTTWMSDAADGATNNISSVFIDSVLTWPSGTSDGEPIGYLVFSASEVAASIAASESEAIINAASSASGIVNAASAVAANVIAVGSDGIPDTDNSEKSKKNLCFAYLEYSSENPCGGCSETCDCVGTYFTSKFSLSYEVPVGLPKLQDKLAARTTIFKKELSRLHLTSFYDFESLSVFALYTLDTGKEAIIAELYQELITDFDVENNAPYPRYWPNHLSPMETFLFALKSVKKLYRKHPWQMYEKLYTILYNHDLESWVDSATHNQPSNLGVYCTEFYKFYDFIMQLNEIHDYFGGENYQLLQHEYKLKHVWIIQIIDNLNKVKHDFSELHVSPGFLKYFIESFLITKKRLYLMLVKLDADMKKSADRIEPQ